MAVTKISVSIPSDVLALAQLAYPGLGMSKLVTEALRRLALGSVRYEPSVSFS